MADRIVPVPAAADDEAPDSLPITGLSELLTHLEAINSDPETTISEKLFDDVELQLTDSNSPPLLSTLLPLLTKPLFTQPLANPQPLLTLLTKLLQPIPFRQILSFSDSAQLLFALRSPLPGANILALSILEKAASSPFDLRILARELRDPSNGTPLVGEVITLWISTRDTGVAEKAARVITQWLEMDCNVVIPPLTPAAANGISHWTSSTTTRSLQQRNRLETPGENLIWDLIFLNPDNLTRIIANCTLTLPPSITSHLPEDTYPRPSYAITTSQGRLLRLLPTLLSLNILPLLQDHTPLFSSFNYTSHNILSWAALEMIDQNDMLMRFTLIDFFEGLVSVARVVKHQPAVKDNFIKGLIRIALAKDERGEVRRAMLTLPDRTVEDEAEPLREYLRDIVGSNQVAYDE